MTEQSKTPRTDALQDKWKDFSIDGHGGVAFEEYQEWVDLATELETENADLRRQVEEAIKERDEAQHHRRMMLDNDLKMQTLVSLQKDFKQAEAKLAAAQAEIAALKEEKDSAYLERNQCVAALTKLFPSVRTKTAIEGWSDDWHGCVYITLPTGQVSWHFHDSHAYLFDHVESGKATWDGHDTSEKYRRLAAINGAENAALWEDAELGRILLRYIDRLNDPTDTDTFEKIVGELSAAVTIAIDAARKG